LLERLGIPLPQLFDAVGDFGLVGFVAGQAFLQLLLQLGAVLFVLPAAGLQRFLQLLLFVGDRPAVVGFELLQLLGNVLPVVFPLLPPLFQRLL